MMNKLHRKKLEGDEVIVTRSNLRVSVCVRLDMFCGEMSKSATAAAFGLLGIIDAHSCEH